MVKPQTRQGLLIAARTRYDELWTQIDALSDADKTREFTFAGRDRNLRDVLVHLSVWQALYLHWSQTNLEGTKRVRFLPQGYSWQDSGKLSRQLQQANQSLSLQKAAARFRHTHTKMIRQLEDLGQEQLFVPGFYSWTGSNTLGDYASVFTAERYDWAIRHLQHFRHDLAQQHMVTQ